MVDKFTYFGPIVINNLTIDKGIVRQIGKAVYTFAPLGMRV